MQVRPSKNNFLLRLIEPLSYDEFVRDYWNQRPVAIVRNDPFHFSMLPGPGVLDGIMSAAFYSTDRLDGRLVRTEGEVLTRRPFKITPDGRLDVHDIYRAYADGFTVVLNRLESKVPVVADLCRQMEAWLHHRVGANLYFTPAGAQGANPHIDGHDVILAQVSGSKRWRVSKNPTRRDRAAANPADAITLGAFEEWEIDQGDSLYIPHGFAHAGVADADASLHVTFGFNATTWADLLTEVFKQVSEHDADLQRPLPDHHFGVAVDLQQARTLTEHFVSALGPDVLAHAMSSLNSRLLTRHAATQGQFPSLSQLASVSSQTRVRHGFVGPWQITTDREEARLEFPGNFVTTPLVLAETLRYAAEHESFTVEELPDGLSTAGKVQLVQSLIREGLLRIM